MKIKYILDSIDNPIDVQSEFIPLVGDYVSLMCCSDLPNDVRIANAKVVKRTYIVLTDTVIIRLKEK